VKRINLTLLCNNEYSSRLLEMDRVVRTLELLEEKNRMSTTATAASVKTQINRHSFGGLIGERKTCSVTERTP